MSNETEALKILEELNRGAKRLGFNYNVSHVLVFTTFSTSGADANFGDEGKWRWMARIPGLDDNSFGNQSLGVDWVDLNEDGRRQNDEFIFNVKGQSTILYKMMAYAKRDQIPTLSLDFDVNTFERYFGKTYFSKGEAIQNQVYARVCIYEVKYV